MQRTFVSGRYREGLVGGGMATGPRAANGEDCAADCIGRVRTTCCRRHKKPRHWGGVPEIDRRMDRDQNLIEALAESVGLHVEVLMARGNGQ